MDAEKPRDEQPPESPEEEHELYEIEDDDGDDASAGRQRLNADFLLDKVIPDEIDWRDLVRRHPVLTIAVAAGLGFAIGRSRGAAIVAGASAAVTSAVMRQLSDVLEGEVFEF
ncbi:MAG: hypothetical protein B7Z68_05990 [Acidobacteria bacterium 21-70-11]|nr:MAG: hypothetical protein B7Z68_05990 [Acidobacteria bacterium 21-70-11]OYW06777.1 MAG: hypothetical protein B7Z61_01315 [Acidobacteria bacterium 37-71-11]HQT93640.1 hypothetical protein [Thermoanaerobaculaceae bacterium]HQU34131.1 hypothetical protein [Thermoanaerobaculaceae bacterium]